MNESENKINLIFDFDGTIADTLLYAIDIAEKLNYKLKLFKQEEIDFEKFRNMDAVQFFDHIKLPKYKILYFLWKFQNILKSEINQIKTFDGIPEIITKFSNLHINMGVVTSNSKINVLKFLQNNDIKGINYIESSIFIFSKDKIIKKALSKYKLDPHYTYYIGDETRDIQAAHKAGIKCISVTWGYNFRNILSKFHPDYIVDTQEELFKLVVDLQK